MASHSAGGSGDGHPGQNRSLEGLLKFALESTAAEDAPGQSTVQMTEEVSGERKQGGVDKCNTGNWTANTTHNADSSVDESRPNTNELRIRQDEALHSLCLYRYQIPGDGNCLFRAIAAQLGLDQDKMHPVLREAAVKWMAKHKDELLVAGLLDTEKEIEESGHMGAWPGQAAIVALANVIGVNIVVIQGGDIGDLDIQHIAPFENTVDWDKAGSILLVYQYSGHYDAVVTQPNLINPVYDAWIHQKQLETEASETLANKLAQEYGVSQCDLIDSNFGTKLSDLKLGDSDMSDSSKLPVLISCTKNNDDSHIKETSAAHHRDHGRASHAEEEVYDNLRVEEKLSDDMCEQKNVNGQIYENRKLNSVINIPIKIVKDSPQKSGAKSTKSVSKAKQSNMTNVNFLDNSWPPTRITRSWGFGQCSLPVDIWDSRGFMFPVRMEPMTVYSRLF